MTRETRLLLTVTFLAAGVAGGLVLGRTLDSRSGPSAQAAPVLSPPPAALASLQESFHAVARTATPSVVHITNRIGAPGDLWQPQGIGSGVIVSAEGHILTNNHVVEAGGARARTLRIRFIDGREFPAEVVGTDLETDLALLKIDLPADVKLKPAVFADSDRVRVGDWVLAIGSPFGYNHTVTAGIVSAKHRRAEMSLPYQDFIQTDAAINPGNSGGALVGINGEVVGINTAIISNTRSSDGVGLAISSNLAKWVTDRLKREGRVKRGYLGVVPVAINQELVDGLRQDGIRSVADLVEDLGLERPVGVFILHVEPGSPAGKAGVKRGDVILEFGGRPVVGKSDMFFKVAQASPGTPVSIKVLRNKQERLFKLDLAERPPMDMRRDR